MTEPDDPHTLHRVSQEIVLPSAFDFQEDAFNSDGEDDGFQFSMHTVREDFAKASWTMDSGAESENEEPNMSVSTIDLEGHCAASPPASQQISRSDSGLFQSSFAQVSLDEDENERANVGDIEEAQHSPPTVHEPSRSPPAMIQAQDMDALKEELPTTPAIHPLESPPPTPQTPHFAPPFPFPSQLVPSSSTLVIESSTLKPAGHRPTRSHGPSTMDMISKTRPTHLPPKTREEDKKHMQDWEAMMKLSRATADKRREALNNRRLIREKRIEDSLSVWEKEIVPDWRVVNKDSALRKLWWGGIPTKLRASMWERAVGNALALSKDTYRTCLARARRALSARTFPPATLDLIEQDMATTLPALHIFHSETGPLYQDLKDMLCAWTVSRGDEGLGYMLGASKIAAMFLINMSAPQGFIVMRNLLERHCMRSFYGGTAATGDVDAYYRIFDTLLADGMPKIYFNFKQHQISPSSYLLDWLLPLFLDHLPFEACARVWDVLLLEGDSFLYRAALGILAVLEPRLFFPEKKELMELLKGENKAALDVAVREGVPLDCGKYAIYGVDEETLWERIDSMDEWWKESTWKRLIQRELPDL